MNDSFRCDKCPKAFVKNYELVRHQKHVHEGVEMPKDHKCQFCEKTFSIPSLRDKHMNAVHYKIKEFKCSYCPEKLPSIGRILNT